MQLLLVRFSSMIGVPVSKFWKPNVTHVIAATDAKGSCTRTLKVLMAILNGNWVLKIDCKFDLHCTLPYAQISMISYLVLFLISLFHLSLCWAWYPRCWEIPWKKYNPYICSEIFTWQLFWAVQTVFTWVMMSAIYFVDRRKLSLDTLTTGFMFVFKYVCGLVIRSFGCVLNPFPSHASLCC